MERNIKNAVIYQGLFLISFALFAQERQKDKVISIAQAESVSLEEGVRPSYSIDTLLRKLRDSSAFKTPIDGVKIQRTKQGILISLSSDELYADGEASVQEHWYPMIDQIADVLLPELKARFKFQIVGYANSLNPRERESVALSQSPYLFSASRAEWLLQYFETKFHLKLSDKITIAGAGAIPNGKRIDFIVSEQE